MSDVVIELDGRVPTTTAPAAVTLRESLATVSGLSEYGTNGALYLQTMQLDQSTARRIAEDRLASAVAAPEGWDTEGTARRVTAPAAHLGRRLIDAVDLERAPWIGPTPDGGLQIIWILDGREAQADVFPNGREVLIFSAATEPVERDGADVESIARHIESVLHGTP
jgi:hypothetical protein